MRKGCSSAYRRVGVNVQPHILQQAIEARHADLIRQADSARLATKASRRRSSGRRLRNWLAHTPAPRSNHGALAEPNA